MAVLHFMATCYIVEAGCGRLKKKRSGMNIEYALIVALIAMGLIVVLGEIGSTTNAMMQSAAEQTTEAVDNADFPDPTQQ